MVFEGSWGKRQLLAGYELLNLGGKKVESRNQWRESRAYKMGSDWRKSKWEGKVKPKKYTLWAGTWDEDEEADYKIVIFFKNSEGSVTVTPLK